MCQESALCTGHKAPTQQHEAGVGGGAGAGAGGCEDAGDRGGGQ